MTTKIKYDELAGKRSVIESRIEEYATWTLPTIFPLQGEGSETEMQNDIQSFGAQAVNHLSNKLVMGLFGPSRSFFRLELTDKLREELVTAGITEDSIQGALQGAEQESVKELDRMGAREPFITAIQHLIITGNSLVEMPTDGAVQVYSVRDYVIERDINSFVIRIIIRDMTRFDALTVDQRTSIEQSNSRTFDDSHLIELFTDIVWHPDDNKYRVNQYADDVNVTVTEGVYPANDLPYIPLVWKLVRGENYGRGLVEDYSGDFTQLSVSELAVSEIMGVIAQIKGLVHPTGITDVHELNASANGEWVSGREEDVSMLSFQEKIADLQAIEGFIDKKERRLSKAFLMDQASVRDAERVTAEEIRLIARDLELALGGVYTRLAQSFQLPIARLLLKRIEFTIDSKLIEPIIVTGLDALSRSGDLDSYRLFIQDVQLLGTIDEEIRGLLNLDRLVNFLAVNNNLDVEMALKTEDELAAKAEQQQRAQEQAIQEDIAMNTAPDLIKAEQAQP